MKKHTGMKALLSRTKLHFIAISNALSYSAELKGKHQWLDKMFGRKNNERLCKKMRGLSGGCGIINMSNLQVCAKTEWTLLSEDSAGSIIVTFFGHYYFVLLLMVKVNSDFFLFSFLVHYKVILKVKSNYNLPFTFLSFVLHNNNFRSIEA